MLYAAMNHMFAVVCEIGDMCNRCLFGPVEPDPG